MLMCLSGGFLSVDILIIMRFSLGWVCLLIGVHMS